jgi:hypothetical protein
MSVRMAKKAALIALKNDRQRGRYIYIVPCSSKLLSRVCLTALFIRQKYVRETGRVTKWHCVLKRTQLSLNLNGSFLLSL